MKTTRTTAMTDQNLSPGAGQKERFVRIRELEKRLGMGLSSIRGLIKDGEFPEPIVIRKKIHVWLESDVDQYIQRKAEAARKGSRVFRAAQSAG
jgi:prophage regulatory protein